MVIYEGKAVFEGVAIGKLSVYKKNEETVKREKVTDVEAEVARYAAARETATEQLQALYENQALDPGLQFTVDPGPPMRFSTEVSYNSEIADYQYTMSGVKAD